MREEFINKIESIANFDDWSNARRLKKEEMLILSLEDRIRKFDKLETEYKKIVGKELTVDKEKQINMILANIRNIERECLELINNLKNFILQLS